MKKVKSKGVILAYTIQRAQRLFGSPAERDIFIQGAMYALKHTEGLEL